MDLKTITLDGVHEESNKLYKKLNHKYDLTIFIARGSYLIGADLSKMNGSPLLEMKCSRTGHIVKNMIGPLLRNLPESILLRLRKNELEKGIHSRNTEKDISYYRELFEYYELYKKILLVDDSIDTGNTLIACENELSKIYPNSSIDTAALNVMSYSKKYPDYYLYEDTMIRGPWSVDSKENKEFIKKYNNWKDNYNKIKIF